jgi:hypothetical protein
MFEDATIQVAIHNRDENLILGIRKLPLAMFGIIKF